MKVILRQNKKTPYYKSDSLFINPPRMNTGGGDIGITFHTPPPPSTVGGGGGILYSIHFVYSSVCTIMSAHYHLNRSAMFYQICYNGVLS